MTYRDPALRIGEDTIGEGPTQIAEDMLARATRLWGAERAGSLRAQIEIIAGEIHRVGQLHLELDRDDPDFLVAPSSEDP